MTYGVLREFRAAITRAATDDAALAVIITGSGGAFCAGTDLSDLQGTPVEDRHSRGTSEEAAPAWFIQQCLKPVIAAVDGPAVGMGAEFSSQCDVRIATSRARFAWNFVHRGLVPDTGAGTWLLPKIIGLTPALRLVLSGDFLSADEALALGYVTEVVEPEALLDAARAEAKKLTRGAPLAGRAAKELMYKAYERGLPEHLTQNREVMEKMFATEDHREGVASFLERREPRFVGR
jgi:enoyl-CoA hydratase/carnithine racemase